MLKGCSVRKVENRWFRVFVALELRNCAHLLLRYEESLTRPTVRQADTVTPAGKVAPELLVPTHHLPQSLALTLLSTHQLKPSLCVLLGSR